MIATVTLNPALDKTMAIRGFAIGGRTGLHRADRRGRQRHQRSQGATQLGCPAMALGFLAGANGRWIADALRRWASLAIRMGSGETRVNLKIKDPSRARKRRSTSPAFKWDRQLESLKRKIEARAGQCRSCVFRKPAAGVPPEIYAEFIRIARNRGARTILDTAGAALKYGIALDRISSSPTAPKRKRYWKRDLTEKRARWRGPPVSRDGRASCSAVFGRGRSLGRFPERAVGASSAPLPLRAALARVTHGCALAVAMTRALG